MVSDDFCFQSASSGSSYRGSSQDGESSTRDGGSTSTAGGDEQVSIETTLLTIKLLAVVTPCFHCLFF